MHKFKSAEKIQRINDFRDWKLVITLPNDNNKVVFVIVGL